VGCGVDKPSAISLLFHYSSLLGQWYRVVIPWGCVCPAALDARAKLLVLGFGCSGPASVESIYMKVI
jgi:hypothetical protein